MSRPTPEMEISPEVAALLGPALARVASAAALADGWTCLVCEQPGRPGEQATLIAWHYLPARFTRVRYAHAACSPSAIITTSASPGLPAALTATACATISEQHDPPAALLIGIPASILRLAAPAGDTVDAHVTATLAAGLVLVTSCCQPLPAVAGLKLTLTPGHAAVTLDTRALYDGTLGFTPEWADAVRAAGRVAIITAAGLDLGAGDPAAAITRAISAGHASGGTARLTATTATPVNGAAAA
jgi:hypothetical protein